MKHMLPTETVNKILQYLAGKAYSEVHQMITEIQQLAEPVNPQEPTCKKITDPISVMETTKEN